MIITANNVALYLLRQGLISADSIVDGDLMVVEMSRRNRNFKISRRKGPSYFAKQIQNWDPMTLAQLQCEASCYWLAKNDPNFEVLAKIMPNYFSYDPKRYVLIIELLPNSETLSDYHRRLGGFPVEIASILGRLLGSYHRDLGKRLQNTSHGAAFPRQIPWILSFHEQNANLLPAVSGGNQQIMNIIKSYPNFPQALKRISNEWKSDSLIHGDIKWDNCIVCHPDEVNGAPMLKIVDWELADIGDRCWDIGAVFQAYLSDWIFSMPMAGLGSSTQLVQSAQYPMEKMLPAIHSFWQEYVESQNFDSNTAADLLERSIRFGAARMIQTAYEYMQYSNQVTNNAVYLLQVSMNILTNPKEAVSDLLGM
jgi:thiamine kinase-like enzyme